MCGQRRLYGVYAAHAAHQRCTNRRSNCVQVLMAECITPHARGCARLSLIGAGGLNLTGVGQAETAGGCASCQARRFFSACVWLRHRHGRTGSTASRSLVTLSAGVPCTTTTTTTTPGILRALPPLSPSSLSSCLPVIIPRAVMRVTLLHHLPPT